MSEQKTVYPWTEPTLAAPFPATEYYGANPPVVRLTVSDDDITERWDGSASRLDHSRFVTIKEAAAMAGVLSFTMSRWIRRGHVATFFDPLDRRVRLVLRADIERMLLRDDLNDAEMSAA